MDKLNRAFYLGADVTGIARQLIGKKLCTKINHLFTSGIITETEAYAGTVDKASHAFGNKLTNRTKTMYENGGICYVYLCYGIHHLFNVVTHQKGIPHAVLIRAIKPIDGIETMLMRRGKTKLDKTLTSGPGAMSKALGINTSLNGTSLMGDRIWIETGQDIDNQSIVATTRIGVGYAQEHAEWPYRFYLKDEIWVSKK